MDNEILRFDQSAMDERALQYFLAISGFSHNPARFQDKLKQALELREKIRSRINPQAVLSRFASPELEGEALKIQGVDFYCKALAQLAPKHVTDFYLYLLSVGNVYWDEGPTIFMLYGDMWGTAYVNATRDCLKALVAEDAKARGALAVSDSFGPGFYGMPVSEIPKFFRLLHADEIGVSLLESALMLPLKTIVGMYAAVDQAGFLPGADCRTCLNQGNHCEFCHARVQAIVDGNSPECQ